MSQSSKRAGRALDAVAREAREQGTPESNAEDLERRLFHAIAEGRASHRTNGAGTTRPYAWLFLPAGAAALLAALATSLPKAPSPPVHSTADDASPPKPLNGDDLAREQVLTASRGELHVAHPGRARWVLSEGAIASVVSTREVIQLRLLRGALRAEVVPSTVPERFVVETEHTRVAVHGTTFRVSLDDEQAATVEVEEGTVAVSRRAQSSRPVFLQAPASARFLPQTSEPSSLGELEKPVARTKVPPRLVNGPPAAAPEVQPSQTILEEVLGAPTASTAPQEEHTEPALVEAEETASASRAPEQPELTDLTIGQVEAGLSTIVQVIGQCFEEHTMQSGDHVTFRAQTTLTLDVSADGVVQSATFSPPLAPPVAICAEPHVRAAEFAPSLEGATIRRVIDLVR